MIKKDLKVDTINYIKEFLDFKNDGIVKYNKTEKLLNYVLNNCTIIKEDKIKIGFDVGAEWHIFIVKTPYNEFYYIKLWYWVDSNNYDIYDLTKDQFFKLRCFK